MNRGCLRKNRTLTTAIGLLLGSLLAPAARSQIALSSLTPEEILSRLEERNAQRQEALRSYTSQRRYAAANPRLHREGYAVIEMQYASGTKTYRVVEKSGSRSIHTRVFEPLLKAEVESSTPEGRAATDISRKNFRFTFVGYDDAANAYLFDAEPLTKNKYLFRGRIWIDAADFAIQRVEGEPAQRPSFWVKSTHFVREYGKFDDFWFPVRHRTRVELRLLGPSTMDIDYFEYKWAPAKKPETADSSAAAGPGNY